MVRPRGIMFFPPVLCSVLMYPLAYLPSGHIYIEPEDDLDAVVDTMLETGYGGEFCFAGNYGEDFAGRLMEAGFLVMSAEITDNGSGTETGRGGNFTVLLPKLHLVRSVLFFPDLHIKKSIRRFLPRYRLRVDTDFGRILDKCVETHGSGWLTPPLVEILKNLRNPEFHHGLRARPVSFGVYRDGELKAGEIGVVMGGVYTSYSGYSGESNAGTVQIILMAQWMEQNGFDFLDLGMPLDYKTCLGARDTDPARFTGLFRAARYKEVMKHP